MDASRLPHMRKMRQQLRKNLDELEHQRAGFGIDPPLQLVNNIAFQSQVLAQIEAMIAMHEPLPEPGALTIETLDDDPGEIAQMFGKAVQELHRNMVQFRQQTHATTLALAQRAVAIESDQARQLAALHKAIAQVHETSTIHSTDTRALVESRLATLAQMIDDANAERIAWQQRETAERRAHQRRLVAWRVGLTLAIMLLSAVVVVARWG